MTRELRDHIASWPTWQRDLWLGSIVFAVVFPGWIVLPPVARLWLVGCVVVAIFVALVTWALDLLHQVELLTAECDAHAAENARLTAARERRFGMGVLRVVPPIAADDYWLNLYDEKGNHRA